MISVAGALALALLAAVAGAATVLVYGQIRHRPRRTVASVLAVLQDGAPLRDALSQVLGDPTLVVWYRLTGSARWVEPDGHFVPEPNPAPGRAQTTIERSGLPIAVFDYDARLAANWDVITAVAKAASLAVQNERLNAEQRAQYAELVTVTDTAPSLLVNVSTEGRILNQNQAAVAVAGTANQEQIRGSYFWDVYIDPSERDDVRQRFRELAPDFAPASTRTRSRTRTASAASSTGEARRSSAEDGTVLSIIAGGLDITDRELLLEEMQRERAFLNAIANNAPSLLALIDETRPGRRPRDEHRLRADARVRAGRDGRSPLLGALRRPGGGRRREVDPRARVRGRGRRRARPPLGDEHGPPAPHRLDVHRRSPASTTERCSSSAASTSPSASSASRRCSAGATS